MKDLVVGMAGAGGDGIVSAGESLIAAAASDGYHAMMTKSFGSQVRGGESSCRVRIATHPVRNPGGTLDVAVALDWDDFTKFGAELPVSPSTVVVYDAKTGIVPDAIPLAGISPTRVFSVPIAEMAKRAAGNEHAKNAVVLGLLAEWFGFARSAILRALEAKFGGKGPELTAANEKAFALGEEYARKHTLSASHRLDRPMSSPSDKLVADGNDVCAAAAIFSGCQFFAGYPITPSSEIMQFLTREIWKYGGVALQAEDEIASIGAALGASFAGQKAMTATSGPGLSLKAEILGLASIAELPLVVVDVQRGGPSTGLPTKAEQSDLFAAAFSAHGDVLRPVLAPTSVADTFAVTVEAFNIAERYQTPVIVLSDQEVAQRKETFDRIDVSRFAVEERRRPTPNELHECQPDLPPRDLRRQLPRGRDRTRRGRESYCERANARAHEPQTIPQARSAAAPLRPLSRRRQPQCEIGTGELGLGGGCGAGSLRARRLRRHRRQVAGAAAPLPRRGDRVSGVLRVGARRVRRRAVAPRTALPDHTHVRRRAFRGRRHVQEWRESHYGGRNRRPSSRRRRP
jgi:2-oxoglutarate/2-oxoacid ferredoxin oxidoreductase subunit alpha